MHLNAKSPQSTTLGLDRKHLNTTLLGGSASNSGSASNLASKPPTNGATVTRQMSTKTVNLKNNSAFIGNNPFLSLNTNWIPNNTNNNNSHIFNTITISNKSRNFTPYFQKKFKIIKKTHSH